MRYVRRRLIRRAPRGVAANRICLTFGTVSRGPFWWLPLNTRTFSDSEDVPGAHEEVTPQNTVFAWKSTC